MCQDRFDEAKPSCRLKWLIPVSGRQLWLLQQLVRSHFCCLYLKENWKELSSFSFTRPEASFQPACSIEGEYVPVEGDEVNYKVCSIPPKYEKVQAVEVTITNLKPGTTHETWAGHVITSWMMKLRQGWWEEAGWRGVLGSGGVGVWEWGGS